MSQGVVDSYTALAVNSYYLTNVQGVFLVLISDKTLHKISCKIGAKCVALRMELELDYCDVKTLQ